MNDKPRIFIGSTSEIKEKNYPVLLYGALSSWAEPVVWGSSFFELSRTTIESLEENLPGYDACVFFLTNDDIKIIRDEITYTPRDNVIFEVGMSMGMHTRRNTFLVAPKERKVKFPTDMMGITVAYYNPGSRDLESEFALISENIKRSIEPFIPTDIDNSLHDIAVLSGAKQAGIVNIFPNFHSDIAGNSFKKCIQIEFKRMQADGFDLHIMGVTLGNYLQSYGVLNNSFIALLEELNANKNRAPNIRALIAHPDNMALRERANMEEAPISSTEGERIDFCHPQNLQYYKNSKVYHEAILATRTAQRLCKSYKGLLEMRHYTQAPWCSLVISDKYAFIESHTSIFTRCKNPIFQAERRGTFFESYTDHFNNIWNLSNAVIEYPMPE